MKKKITKRNITSDAPYVPKGKGRDEEVGLVIKPIICGHEEVPAPEGYKGDEKWFKCGKHGIHKLSDCSKLCI